MTNEDFQEQLLLRLKLIDYNICRGNKLLDKINFSLVVLVVILTVLASIISIK